MPVCLWYLFNTVHCYDKLLGKLGQICQFTLDWACVTHKENLSSFDRDRGAGDHPKVVVDALSDVGDAIVRQ